MRGNASSMPLAATLALSLALVGCDGGGGGGDDVQTPAPTPPPTGTPAPTPAPTPTPTGFNVTPCLQQTVVPGRTVANLVVPDVLRLDLDQAAGFPNGRRYLDPVIDVTLAVLFLDLTTHAPDTFARIPVNPGPGASSDPTVAPPSATFPFLSPPQGNPPIGPIGGANWNFRTESTAAYTRVDRMGMPAVATALIGSPNKNAYNDDSPAGDATGRWVPELANQLTILTNALADDFIGLGLDICAEPG